jgi:hypothetical protein
VNPEDAAAVPARGHKPQDMARSGEAGAWPREAALRGSYQQAVDRTRSARRRGDPGLLARQR